MDQLKQKTASFNQSICGPVKRKKLWFNWWKSFGSVYTVIFRSLNRRIFGTVKVKLFDSSVWTTIESVNRKKLGPVKRNASNQLTENILDQMGNKILHQLKEICFGWLVEVPSDQLT